MSCVSNVVVIHHACNVYIACITHSAFGTKLCGLVAHAAMEGMNHQLSPAKLHYITCIQLLTEPVLII